MGSCPRDLHAQHTAVVGRHLIMNEKKMATKLVPSPQGTFGC